MPSPDRTQYIGSSDAIDLMGDRWFKTWEIKTGAKKREDLSNVFRVQLGLHTEDFHIDWMLKRLNEREPDLERYTEVSRQKWHELGAPGTPIGAHTDVILHDAVDDQYSIGEVKHTGGHKSQLELVQFYMPQLQHHMMCTGLSLCCFSAIHGNSEPERSWVAASHDYQSAMFDRYVEFWEYVIEGRPPVDYAVEPVAEEIVNAVKIDDMRKVDLSRDNTAAALAHQYIETKQSHDVHAATKEALKELAPLDAYEIVLPGLLGKRTKAGALRWNITMEENA